MIYFELEQESIGFPKRQTLSNQGTQSQWVPTKGWDSQVAEEAEEILNPKVLPLGFLFEGKVKMRELREYKEETVYYVTARTSSRELLYRDDSDYSYFLEMLKNRQEKYNFKLYAYCLLPQHYHLLLEPAAAENLSKVMQAINTSYSLYFNNKYNRSGHLLSGRFKSALFNKDERLLHQSIYLHLNPVRLGLAVKAEDYKWASYREYIGKEAEGITDKGYILSFLDTPEKYKEMLEGLEAVRTPGVAKKKAAKKIRYKIGYSVAALCLIGGLIILPQVLIHKTNPGILNNAFTKEMSVSLPEGLYVYQDSENTQNKAQVWELWKIGPVKQGESYVAAQ